MMKQYSHTENVDAVVVGTGAGGAPVLARLARAGLKVVALEAGKYWDPPKDFATDEREQHKLYWQDERLSAGDDPLPFGRNNSGIGVGGSTLHYTGFVPRPHPDDFRLFSDFGVADDWPLTYDDLEPYFDEIEQFIGVSGPAVYPWNKSRKIAYPLPPLPLNGTAQLMQRGAKELDILTANAPTAALSHDYFHPDYGQRSACTLRGFCEAGCTTGAKGSTDVTYIPAAIKYGAEIRPECFVEELRINNAGKIESVVYEHSGQKHIQLCKAVFLCAGAVETPRLLLLNGIANSSGTVGKYFMAHVSLQIWGQFHDMVRPYKGFPTPLISEEMHRPKDATFAGGYLLESIGVMPVTYASQLARATGIWGRKLQEKMLYYNHSSGINMHGDCLPYRSNYLTLSNEPDARGLPKPIIYFSNGKNEKEMEDHGRKIMNRLWKAAGGFDLWEYPRNSHTLGTCRMGSNGEDAVVDQYGQSFEIPNLFIADGSVFTTSLSVNPALTIMAIALRSADNFINLIKRNEL